MTRWTKGDEGRLQAVIDKLKQAQDLDGDAVRAALLTSALEMLVSLITGLWAREF